MKLLLEAVIMVQPGNLKRPVSIYSPLINRASGMSMSMILRSTRNLRLYCTIRRIDLMNQLWMHGCITRANCGVSSVRCSGYNSFSGSVRGFIKHDVSVRYRFRPGSVHSGDFPMQIDWYSSQNPWTKFRPCAMDFIRPRYASRLLWTLGYPGIYIGKVGLRSWGKKSSGLLGTAHEVVNGVSTVFLSPQNFGRRSHTLRTSWKCGCRLLE